MYEEEDEELEFEILEYFEDEYQEYWRNEIKRAEFSDSEYLYKLLNENELKNTFGEKSKLYMLTDGESLISFCVLAQKNNSGNDFNTSLETGWINFLFTFPSYRNQKYQNILVDEVCNFAKEIGYSSINVISEDKSFFESLGFSIKENFFSKEL